MSDAARIAFPLIPREWEIKVGSCRDEGLSF